jgi:hypothetical protein
VWLDGHLDVLQPHINGKVWNDGSQATLQRNRFNTAFARYVENHDFSLLPPGGGMLPSNRRCPGKLNDLPPDLD